MVIGYTFPNEISYYHHYIIYLCSLKPLLNIGKHTAVSSIPLQGGMHDILALNLTQKKTGRIYFFFFKLITGLLVLNDFFNKFHYMIVVNSLCFAFGF